jgi:hypothetical protein
MAQIVERILGGRDRLDPEPLEQGARQEFRPLQLRVDLIVDPVGIGG